MEELQKYRIVAMTLHKLGELADNVRNQRKSNHQPLNPDVVVVEEAGQILEASMCNAIAVISDHARLIQIGDHMQIPATCRAIDDKPNAYDRSQFEKLLLLKGLTKYIMSEIQHRMVPSIAAY